jgi:hypothetical protein
VCVFFGIFFTKLGTRAVIRWWSCTTDAGSCGLHFFQGSSSSPFSGADNLRMPSVDVTHDRLEAATFIAHNEAP